LEPGDWLRADPLAIAVRRVTLAPGAELPPSEEATPTLRYVEQGVIGRGITGPNAPPTPQPPLRFGAAQWVPWAPFGPDRQAAFANVGDDSLVFLEVSIGAGEPD
jgi:hypothetical protein